MCVFCFLCFREDGEADVCENLEDAAGVEPIIPTPLDRFDSVARPAVGAHILGRLPAVIMSASGCRSFPFILDLIYRNKILVSVTTYDE